MDKVNILSGDKFPMYREGLNIIQEAAFMASKTALLGGNNFILSGCLSSFGMTTDGIVVINGELLPFMGGSTGDKITIKETRKDVTAFNVTYPEVYIARWAQFSYNGEYNWSDFEQIKSNVELYTLIKNITGDALGVIKEWAGAPSKIPADYMLCDGRDLAISDYPELYETIGITFGGDGLTSFKLPNTGGRFSVGYSGAGDYAAIGGMGGEERHKLTITETPKHNHANSDVFNKLSARAADVNELGTPGSIDTIEADKEYNVGSMTPQRWTEAKIQDIGNDEAHENRPPYIVFAKIIKVR